ncbi:hypothetical protein Pla86_27500 [Planctomycetes bacterium Pla86]|uniref:Uncharacterized protein n=1 Tax=Engelhardtia mirabilis TaxID=2528011 RepID=A0A518BL36_9BACT|nr:hypothetical protein Pla133_27510 [Planctomycetes bacterium Pla133]QDV01989.1 hypothetical protein Pla86_27500 [Planctomycetes bacterium Pla86]
MAQSKRKAGGRAAVPVDPVACPLCDDDEDEMSRHGLKLHLVRVHRMPTEEAVDAANRAQRHGGPLDIARAVRAYLAARRELAGGAPFFDELPADAVAHFRADAEGRAERLRLEIERACEKAEGEKPKAKRRR